MGRIVRFSEFDAYFKELVSQSGFPVGTILDANVIITLSYSPKKYHSRLLNFLSEKIHPDQIPCFTTVNTTSEFLEFHRRLLITEGLRDAIDEYSRLALPNKKRQIIRYHSQRLKNRETNQGADPVFYDREIKDIRNKFCASGEKGLALWNSLCEAFLGEKLEEEYQNLGTLDIKYISIHEESQKSFFTKKIEWSDAIAICAQTCVGFSDAMILNALQATRFPFVISLDIDLGYAVLSDRSIKDVVMPDDLIDDTSELAKLAGL